MNIEVSKVVKGNFSPPFIAATTSAGRIIKSAKRRLEPNGFQRRSHRNRIRFRPMRVQVTTGTNSREFSDSFAATTRKYYQDRAITKIRAAIDER